VHRLERVADDVVILYLKLPANERLQFLAGQYVEFILKDGSRRSFSMANAPHDDEFLQLHVRHVPGGAFTDHVFKTMKERDILRFEGPLGSFFLHESEKPIVFVASGTGFAPIKAIIESAFKKGVERPMTLYWGARRPKDLYLDELPHKWAAEHPQQFKYVPVISEALPEDQWTGRTGFVHRAVMQDLPDLSGYQVYACGVPIMVDSARRDFTHECRLPIDEFFADSFTTQADLAAG
jgi:CDP-4-dehydro-6-deoxyglucose reductase